MKFLINIYNYLLRLVTKREIKENLKPDNESKTKPPSNNKKRKSEIEQNWIDGDYKSMSDLLSDLNFRYEWLRCFKPLMADEHLRAIKKFGVYMAGVFSHEEWIEYQPCEDINLTISGGSNRKMPTFMCIGYHAYNGEYGEYAEGETILFRDILMYANKEHWKHNKYNVEKPRGEYFYVFGYIIRCSKKHYEEISVPIEIMPDGTLEILRQKSSHTVVVPHKNGWPSTYDKVAWDKYTLPPTTQMEDAGKAEREIREHFTKQMFIKLYLNYMRMDASTTIHATKGMARMIFTVPAHTWKNFFKDRITAKATDGKRKRIFHHVAAHKRKNGQTVPMHTRGETRFKWDGFNIKICELKKGRMGLTDFDLTGERYTREELEELHRIGERTLSQEEMTQKILPMITKDLHIPTEKAS